MDQWLSERREEGGGGKILKKKKKCITYCGEKANGLKATIVLHKELKDSFLTQNFYCFFL